MTQDEFDRMVRLFARKAQSLPRAGYTDEDDEEWLEAVIGTAVADTLLVIEDGVALDRWEPEREAEGRRSGQWWKMWKMWKMWNRWAGGGSGRERLGRDSFRCKKSHVPSARGWERR